MSAPPRWLRKLVFLSVGLVACVIASATVSFLVYDHNNPPALEPLDELSTQVVDADGKLLRAFVTKQGRWRLKVELDNVDSEFVKLLIAYEDKRFWSHHGIDLRAMARAFGQLIINGRIISGASTITMQLARLLEPRTKRSLSSKFRQIILALQLERRLSKQQILTHYLTFAPYGGNLEGIRAASLAYFGKEPKGLTLSQAALLVALPQSPESRRPDRFANHARDARNRVLARMAQAGVIAPGEVARAAAVTVSPTRIALPQYAAHLAQMARAKQPQKRHFQLSVKRNIQRSLESVIRKRAARLDEEISIALVLADAQTGQILAQIGSPNYLDEKRSGWIDMTQAIRSPGSTLKPLIYGLAFEEGLIKPETLMLDSPINFAGYRPQNFDMDYQGEISVRRALQLSLNVPAVQLLEAVGPTRLLSRMKSTEVNYTLPPSEDPGLAIGLGGIGISLIDLVQLYCGLANGGIVNRLVNGLGEPNPDIARPASKVLLRPDANWLVTDILATAPAPANSDRLTLAYKTGTSYGYRDAWSVGYDGRHVLGVWVGRADNGSVPGITGLSVAAPILFEAFARSGLASTPFAPAPKSVVKTAHHDLPVTLRHFKPTTEFFSQARVPEHAPQIVYPPEGARIELTKRLEGAYIPLMMKMQNGRPPFRWLANGALFSTPTRRRNAIWHPDGSGYSTLTVIDAVGRAASVNVFITKSD